MPKIYSRVVRCSVTEYWADDEEGEPFQFPFMYQLHGPFHQHVDGEEVPKLVSGGDDEDFDAEALHALTVPPYGKPTTKEGST